MRANVAGCAGSFLGLSAKEKVDGCLPIVVGAVERAATRTVTGRAVRSALVSCFQALAADWTQFFCGGPRDYRTTTQVDTAGF